MKLSFQFLFLGATVFFAFMLYQNYSQPEQSLEQSSLSTPNSMLFQSPGVEAENVYSPSMVIQGGTLVMYFGGWYRSNQVHDNIYRSECRSPLQKCEAAASLLDSQALGFAHLNDPSVLLLPNGLYLMYMTGVIAGEDGLIATKNHVYYSTSKDAIHWNKPALIAGDIWMPSATLDAQNNVLVFGNSTVDGRIVRYNLGPAGNKVISRDVLQLPKFYLNIEVTYQPKLGTYQILAEQGGISPNQIDYLTSADGFTWQLIGDGIIKPRAGKVTVRTPTPHPTNHHIVYYAETANPNSTQNKMLSVQWDQQKTQPPQPPRPPPASQPSKLTSAKSSNVLPGWDVAHAIDGNPGTAYSSNTALIDRFPGLWIAAWFADGPKDVSRLELTARIANGSALGFPRQYEILITDPGNTRWNSLGIFTHQPDASGVARIALGGPFSTHGVQIVPLSLGKDDVGNFVFQLAEMNLR